MKSIALIVSICTMLLFSCASQPSSSTDRSNSASKSSQLAQTSSSPKVKSCYYHDDEKKQQADEHLAKALEFGEQMQRASEQKDKYAAMFKLQDHMHASALLGQPEALDRMCGLGLDSYAPKEMRDTGLEFCRFAMETVPGLKQRLHVNNVAALEKVQYTRLTEGRCTL